MIWSGLFSVRSGYHLAKENFEHTKAGSSNGFHNSAIWKTMWKLKGPNTEKHFIWRACHDILPRRENLIRRKIVSDPFCLICGLEVETVSHILWECSSTMNVWGACKPFQKLSITGQSFIRLFEEIAQTGRETDMRLFVVLTRQIWLRQNKYVHEGIFANPNTLVWQAYNSIAEYDATCTRDGLARESCGTITSQKWQAPPKGVYKANWDTALSTQNERIGLGNVIQDQKGNVKAAQCMVQNGRVEPDIAEALAAVQTLILCRDLGQSKIQLEGDATNVVKVMNSEEVDWSKIIHIIEDARFLKQQFLFCEIIYVGQEGNNVAHNLAKLTARLGLKRQ
jgi:ribonuclease HI